MARLVENSPLYAKTKFILWDERLCRSTEQKNLFGTFLIKIGISANQGMTSFYDNHEIYQYSEGSGDLLEFLENELFHDLAKENSDFAKFYRQAGVREQLSDINTLGIFEELYPDLTMVQTLDSLGGHLDMNLAKKSCLTLDSLSK